MTVFNGIILIPLYPKHTGLEFDGFWLANSRVALWCGIFDFQIQGANYSTGSQLFMLKVAI